MDRNAHISIFAASAAVLLWFSACAEKEPAKAETPALEKMDFAVNEAYLGLEYSNPGRKLALRVPAGWEQVDDARLTDFRAKAAADAERCGYAISFEPFAVFIDSATSSFLSLSEVRGSVADPAGTMRADLMADEAVSRFLIDEFEVTQTRTISEESIHMRLLFDHGNDIPFLADYLITTADFESNVKKLESSLGTIHRID